MTERIPYFYIIQDVRNSMYYVGSKFGRGANPANFLTEGGYTTSSKIINAIIKEIGIDVFIVRRLKAFDTPEQAYQYETKFLKRVNAKSNKAFYNQHNNDALWAAGTENYKNFMLDTYGVDHNMKIPETQLRRKNTINRRYGSYKNMLHETGVIRKSQQTCLDIYGTKHYILMPDVVSQREKVCMEKYGVPNVFFSKEMQSRMRLKGIQTAKDNNDEIQKPNIVKVINSDIDFSMFGWVGKVAVLLDVPPQYVKRWMIRNMPSFYEERCYKRKQPTFG